MWVYSAAAQDRFHSKASQLWPQGAFPEGSSESVEQRRYRLGVRTPDSQSGNPGSIPGTATNSSPSTPRAYIGALQKLDQPGIYNIYNVNIIVQTKPFLREVNPTGGACLFWQLGVHLV